MRLLFIYASAGAGHRKAAQALVEYAQGLADEATGDLVLADALDHTARWYRVSYEKGYEFMVSRAPCLWAAAFHGAGFKPTRRVTAFFRRWHNHVHGRRLERWLIAQNFDGIVSTHFFPTEVAAFLKRTGRLSSRLVTCVTDFDVHPFWVVDGVDVYACACDFTRERLIELGVAPECVHVTGIPVSPVFAPVPDRRALRIKLGLDPDQFTVLLATGSFGFNVLESVARCLDRDCQGLIVCGRNEKLRQRLAQAGELDHMRVYGLVDNMHELMAAADAFITKPGGLSIAEALVMGLPMVFIRAIPGQEERNIEVLRRYGVGVAVKEPDQAASVIHHWRMHPKEHRRQIENTRALGRPNAAKDILQLVTSG